jgi:hypothetical protein
LLAYRAFSTTQSRHSFVSAWLVRTTISLFSLLELPVRERRLLPLLAEQEVDQAVHLRFKTPHEPFRLPRSDLLGNDDRFHGENQHKGAREFPRSPCQLLDHFSSFLSAEHQQRDDESEKHAEPERMTSVDSLHLADYHEPPTLKFLDSFHDDADVRACHQKSQYQPNGREQISLPPSLSSPSD